MEQSVDAVEERARPLRSSVGADLRSSTFDPDETVLHEYLGELQDVAAARGGRSDALEEGKEYTLPIVPILDVVLFPGETLPFRGREEEVVLESMRLLEADAHIFGVVRAGASTMSLVGTTAEIRTARADETRGPSRNISLITKGRQRFQIRSFARRQGMFMAKVIVLPESDPVELPQFLFSARCNGDNDIRDISLCSIPRWAWRPYDALAFARQLREMLPAVFGDPSLVDRFEPLDPRALSYWLGANLPLSPNIRARLLGTRTCAERLQREIRYCNQVLENRTCRCVRCGNEVADFTDVFTMNSEGYMSPYVNAHGYVHETVTFRTARGISFQGTAHTKDSWFPGYAWTIIVCNRCGGHLGWQFTACKDGLTPEWFFGLCGSAIRMLDNILTSREVALESEDSFEDGLDDGEDDDDSDAVDEEAMALQAMYAQDEDGEDEDDDDYDDDDDEDNDEGEEEETDRRGSVQEPGGFEMDVVHPDRDY